MFLKRIFTRILDFSFVKPSHPITFIKYGHRLLFPTPKMCKVNTFATGQTRPYAFPISRRKSLSRSKQHLSESPLAPSPRRQPPFRGFSANGSAPRPTPGIQNCTPFSNQSESISWSLCVAVPNRNKWFGFRWKCPLGVTTDPGSRPPPA